MVNVPFVPADHADQFRRRVIQDAMMEATACYWQRRAGYLQTCLPQPGDFNGEATYEELRERAAALQQTIDACLNKARVIRGQF